MCPRPFSGTGETAWCGAHYHTLPPLKTRWPLAGKWPVESEMWPTWTLKTSTGKRKLGCLGDQNMSQDHLVNLIEEVTESLCLGTSPVATEFTLKDVAPTL